MVTFSPLLYDGDRPYHEGGAMLGEPKMGIASFRYDYAKFLIECTPELWAHWYQGLNLASHERKYSTEWLKSHKVNRLWYNAAANKETWSIDIWGEWAGIVDVLDAAWFPFLKRLDVRAIVWDADEAAVSSLGLHLFKNITSHNIRVFNTRPATKRLGRDRGGIGFAIGSHKSDLRISVYKRTGEPVALEYQMSGAFLERLKGEVCKQLAGGDDTVDYFFHLRERVKIAGETRLTRVLDAAGIGSYWPTLGSIPAPELPPTQYSFAPPLEGDDLPPLPEYTGA